MKIVVRRGVGRDDRRAAACRVGWVVMIVVRPGAGYGGGFCHDDLHGRFEAAGSTTTIFTTAADAPECPLPRGKSSPPQ
ncbi:hypothetical protein [Haloactinopolyspora sp.]|uniref:hypothetical protein n=1 Tax=Haloactinopolyspora sp. TaxID=1966353 RepID=UPI00261A5169|nr:hypothetical protein [Haloactinopolyspora sp.]